ncbi:CLUMA_CG007647, isoform A [Clunio marinus]|uniref:DNA polymerase delta subunit 3 n=1 Tax=Clunio marinus TaxID=568069 RepID=A0A1J1I3F4_9DIPT|nr:CLUMA_CG007647, isoform A [Clunio marinus]
MESTTEKSCLEEISTLVFDSCEKVTLKTISNNWMIKTDVAKDVLSKWLDQNKKKDLEIEIEYLVTGLNPQGTFSISIATKEKKSLLEKKWKNFGSWIYSVEIKSSSRKLNLPDYEPIKMKNILLKAGNHRDLHIPKIATVKQEPIAKAEPPKAKTPFNVIKPATKVEIKKENPKPVAISEEKVVKEISPNKPQQKASSKTANSKNQKPVTKGSISSFFNSKPSSSKASVEKPSEVVVKKEEKAPEADVIVVTPEKKSQKKEASKKKKTIKLKETANNKRSRIRVMQDSSDDDQEDEEKDSEEPESKLIKFDREFTPERKTPCKASPEKTQVEAEKVKRKCKRWVTKRYQTEDGFMKTERVQEEYSASEDENDENKKKNSPPTVVKKTTPAKKSTTSKAQSEQINKMEHKNFLLIFSVLLLSMTCNGERFIVNVVEYEIENAGVSTLKCAGTIISDRHVVTTAVCAIAAPTRRIAVEVDTIDGVGSITVRYDATVRIHPDFAATIEYNVAGLEIDGIFDRPRFSPLSLGALSNQTCFLYGWGAVNSEPRRESVTVNFPDSCAGDNPQAYCSNFNILEVISRCNGLLPGSPLICGDGNVVNGMVLNGGCNTFQPYLYYHSMEEFSSWILWETAGAEMTTKVSGFLLFAALLTCLKNIL